VIWSLVIGALVAVTMAFWPAFQGSSGIAQAINQLPAGVVQAFGLAEFGTPAGFLRGNLYDFLVPLLLVGAAVGMANGLTASDEDSGRMELVLVQPVKRGAVFGGRAIAAAVALIVVGGVLTAVQLAANQAVGMSIGLDRIVPTLALVVLLAAFHGGLTLMTAGLTPRPSLALGIGLGVAVAGLVASALFPLSPALKPFVSLSPWEWALGHNPLVAATDLWRYAALGIPAVAFTVLGAIGFARRDVHAA
jgi:ABC-2 type transport system permease protein